MRKWVLISLIWILFTSVLVVNGQENKPYFGPLPLPSLEPITTANAHLLKRIASIGIGELEPNIAWSPDGHWLAVPSSAGIWLYDAANWGTNPILLVSTTGAVKTVSFNAAGRLLYAGDSGGSIQVWDPIGRVQITAFDTGLKAVDGLALSPNGTRLAAKGVVGVGLWQIVEPLQGDTTFIFEVVFFRPESRAGLLRFTADGKQILTGERSRRFDTTTGEALPNPPILLLLALQGSYAFSTDGRLFAAAVNDEVQILDFTTGEMVKTLPISDASNLLFIDNNTQLLFSTPRHQIQVWDINTAQKLRDLPSKGRSVRAIAVSPDGDEIAYGSSDMVEVWRLDSDVNVLLQRSAIQEVGFSGVLTFSPTNLLVYTSNSSISRGLWLADLDSQHFEFLAANYGRAKAAFSSQGDWMLTAGDALRMWYLPQRVLDAIYPHLPISDVAFNPDNQGYASGADVIRIWNFKTRTLKQVVGEDYGRVVGLAYNSDGTRLASAHLSKKTSENDPHQLVVIWDTLDYQPSLILPNYIQPIIFQPGANHLLVHECTAFNKNGLCTEKIAHMLDGAAGEPLYSLPSEVHSPVFSADGSLLVGGTADGRLIIWDAKNGNELGHWQAEWVDRSPLVALSPDRRYIVTMSTGSPGMGSPGVGWVWGIVPEN